MALLLALRAGRSQAQGPEPGEISIAGVVASRISYQGLLKQDSVPVTGSRDMIFRMYSDGACTSQVGNDIPKNGVVVDDGLFSVALDVDQSHFNGQGLWLAVETDGNSTDCLEILPTPYALSLRPGAEINASDRALTLASTNGSALFVQSSSAASHINGAALRIHQTNPDTGIAVWADSVGRDSALVVSNNGSGPLIKGFGNDGGEHEFMVENDGSVVVTKLQITGGSDLSEQFDIRNRADGLDPAPGMVVSIDPENPGELTVSHQAYDRRVAGIISGAGDVQPGMLMGQRETVADGLHPVALTGRVYCWADAAYGAIRPGDLLTTSDTPGHVMRVNDYDRAQGAIIGKAMSALEEGQGLVLILVSLG